MPSISIKKGVSVVRLYDGERRQIDQVLVTLRTVQSAALSEGVKSAAEYASEHLAAFVDCFPEPEKKPRKKKAATAAA